MIFKYIDFSFNDLWNRTLSLISADFVHDGVYTCQVGFKSQSSIWLQQQQHHRHHCHHRHHPHHRHRRHYRNHRHHHISATTASAQVRMRTGGPTLRREARVRVIGEQNPFIVTMHRTPALYPLHGTPVQSPCIEPPASLPCIEHLPPLHRYNPYNPCTALLPCIKPLLSTLLTNLQSPQIQIRSSSGQRQKVKRMKQLKERERELLRAAWRLNP